MSNNALTLLKTIDTILTEVDKAIKEDKYDIAIALLKVATTLTLEITETAKQ